MLQAKNRLDLEVRKMLVCYLLAPESAEAEIMDSLRDLIGQAVFDEQEVEAALSEMLEEACCRPWLKESYLILADAEV